MTCKGGLYNNFPFTSTLKSILYFLFALYSYIDGEKVIKHWYHGKLRQGLDVRKYKYFSGYKVTVFINEFILLLKYI